MSVSASLCVCYDGRERQVRPEKVDPRGRPIVSESPQNSLPVIGPPRFFVHDCGYLPDRQAITEERVAAALPGPLYQAALSAGYRRFGDTLFRPRCPDCAQCIPLRVSVEEFQLRRQWRRILKKNTAVEIVVQEASASPEAVELANRFHAHRAGDRGWNQSTYTQQKYHEQFCSGPVTALAAHYRLEGELLGIGLFDDLPDGETAVIFHYVARFKERSPGSLNVLWLIERARARQKPYVYLGYWIPGSVSADYKVRFRPAEILEQGAWIPLRERPGGAGSDPMRPGRW
jgi:leucyl-tRNA---protein transferase